MSYNHDTIMKTNFKYHIAAVLAFCAALFGPSLITSAQNLPEGTYEEINGIAFRKSATLVPGTNNQYDIDLEAFVTGTVTVTHGVKPTDIALVLDVSGSMYEPVPGTRSLKTADYWKRLQPRNIRDHNMPGHTSITGYTYYYSEDGVSFYPIEMYKSSSNQGRDPNGSYRTRYFARIRKSDGTYYLGPGGASKINNLVSNGYWTEEARNCSTTGDNFDYPFDFQNLYCEKERIEVLKEASTKFVDVVKNNNPAEGEHQIALVTFGTGAQTLEGGFTPVSTGYNSLLAKINGLSIPPASHTATNDGLKEARNILNTLVAQEGHGNEDTQKFVVLFTDGEPTDTGNAADFTRTAEEAIGYAKEIKNLKGSIKGTIFAIGMIDNPSDNARKFMNFVSSNYPEAQNMNTPQASGSWNGEYYVAASGADLSDIFEAVAEQTAGNATNTSVSKESAVTVDVVSTSFVAPSNVSDVTVLVAPCTGQSTQINPKTGKNYLSFGAPVDPESVGFTITPYIEGDKISTSGFDYSENFCWYNADADPQYGGYKQIIRFRVTASEDAVGGPNVETNHESSGIYIDDPENPGQKKQIAVFNRPTVKVPVQIWIAKDGLIGNDNAVFTLYWADPTGHYVEDPNNPGHEIVDVTGIAKNEWVQFTKVTINNNITLKYNYNGKEIPLVKIPGLDPDNVYQIKEDAWSWSYEPETRIMYTVGENVQNPFIFVNIPKENLKEAEHSIRNVFNPGN